MTAPTTVPKGRDAISYQLLGELVPIGSDRILTFAAQNNPIQHSVQQSDVQVLLELDAVVLHRLAELFQMCFAGAPWNEKWTNEMAADEILSYMRSDADIFIFCDRNNESSCPRIVGFAVALPLSKYEGAEQFTGMLIDLNIDQTYYFAELCVDPSARRIGIGQRLTNMVNETGELRTNMTYFLTRTHPEQMHAINRFKKIGCKKIGTMVATNDGGLTTTERVVFGKQLGQQ